MSYKSDHVFRECRAPVLKISHLIEDLSEHELKGILARIENEAQPAGEGTEHLWRGVGEFVEWTLRLRKARRSPRGIWYATVIQLTPMHDSPSRNTWAPRSSRSAGVRTGRQPRPPAGRCSRSTPTARLQLDHRGRGLSRDRMVRRPA